MSIHCMAWNKIHCSHCIVVVLTPEISSLAVRRSTSLHGWTWCFIWYKESKMKKRERERKMWKAKSLFSWLSIFMFPKLEDVPKAQTLRSSPKKRRCLNTMLNNQHVVVQYHLHSHISYPSYSLFGRWYSTMLKESLATLTRSINPATMLLSSTKTHYCILTR